MYKDLCCDTTLTHTHPHTHVPVFQTYRFFTRTGFSKGAKHTHTHTHTQRDKMIQANIKVKNETAQQIF